MSAAIIVALLVMTLASVNTKQLSCSNGRSFIATEDHILSGHIISTHQVSSLLDCFGLCVEHPRCLSHNFQVTSISSSHACEINDATAKMCPQDMIKKTGYNYYEDKDASYDWQYPPGDVPETNFQVTFPRQSVLDYVRFDLQRSVPPLTSFTLCLWLNVSEAVANAGSIFSYSLPNVANEILLYDYTDLSLWINEEASAMNNAVNNGVWRHVCTSWENAAGSWNLYIDGALLANGDNLKTGHVIDNNGTVILGQDQDSYGGGFDQYQSFSGQMYGVNMWNRVLAPEEILHMSANCSYGVGNYLRWRDFVTGLHGNVSLSSPATCLP